MKSWLSHGFEHAPRKTVRDLGLSHSRNKSRSYNLFEMFYVFTNKDSFYSVIQCSTGNKYLQQTAQEMVDVSSFE